MTRAIGLDLGLACTGFAVLDAGPDRPLLVTRGYFAPPAALTDPQEKADYIVDQVLEIAIRYGGEVFIEQPIANVWMGDEKRTNPASALGKGRLVGSVETALRLHKVRYTEIGIHRWRNILGVEGKGKDAVVAWLKVWLAQRGIAFPENVKADEVEACGVAASALIAIEHPEMLAEGWKRKRPKKAKAQKAPQQRGVFDGLGEDPRG